MGCLGDDVVEDTMRMPFQDTVLEKKLDDIIIVLEHIESYHGS